MNKSLKEIQENTNSWRKWMHLWKESMNTQSNSGRKKNKTVWGQKTELELIKKPQSSWAVMVLFYSHHTGGRGRHLSMSLRLAWSISRSAKAAHKIPGLKTQNQKPKNPKTQKKEGILLIKKQLRILNKNYRSKLHLQNVRDGQVHIKCCR